MCWGVGDGVRFAKKLNMIRSASVRLTECKPAAVEVAAASWEYVSQGKTLGEWLVWSRRRTKRASLGESSKGCWMHWGCSP
jgi:hypothetical protein